MQIKDALHITIPMPPSINACFGTNWNTKRRFKSKKYEEWIEVCDVLLMARNFRIRGDSWLAVEYKLYTNIYNKDGTKKKKDTENYIKPISDYLTHKIEGFDDHRIKTMSVTKYQSDRDEVDIILREIGDVV